MVKINLGELKSMVDDLAAYLEEELGVKPVIDGGKVMVEGEGGDVRVRDVKLHIKKFLHRRGLRRRFRVLVNKDDVKLVSLELEEEEE